jgi:hypothetical protein
MSKFKLEPQDTVLMIIDVQEKLMAAMKDRNGYIKTSICCWKPPNSLIYRDRYRTVSQRIGTHSQRDRGASSGT